MKTLYEKRIQGGVLRLVESNPPGDTEIQVAFDDPRGGPPFKAIAHFPPEARDIAKVKIQHARGKLSIEDLLREWSDDEVWARWQTWWSHKRPSERTRLLQPPEYQEDTGELLPLDEYDVIIVSFSGGKDSLACLLYILEQGVDPDKIELWHQAVDGRPEEDDRFFDWPCTEAYCKAIAEAFDIPLYFQWREKGFQGEMLKVNRTTAPVGFELEPGGLETGKVGTAGGAGKVGSRMMFPVPSPNLMVRWCSALLKIDVSRLAINNMEKFKEGKFLYVTGERREESRNRAGYADVIEHKSTTKKRRIEQWRPILDWMEPDVWRIIEKFRVRAHPAYYLGWGRVSCFPCIFGSPSQWATIREIDPELFNKILTYERQFQKRTTYTIQDGGDIEWQANRGKPFNVNDPINLKLALSEDYPEELAIVHKSEKWILPAGALGRVDGACAGPV